MTICVADDVEITIPTSLDFFAMVSQLLLRQRVDKSRNVDVMVTITLEEISE